MQYGMNTTRGHAKNKDEHTVHAVYKAKQGGGEFVVHGVFDSTALCRKSHVENVAVEGVATTQHNAISISRPTQAHNKIIIKADRQETEDIRAAHAHTCDPTCVMHPRAHGLSWGRQLVC